MHSIRLSARCAGRASSRRALVHIAPALSNDYRLIDTDMHDILVVLLSRRPVVATLHPAQRELPGLHLVMCLMPETARIWGYSSRIQAICLSRLGARVMGSCR